MDFPNFSITKLHENDTIVICFHLQSVKFIMDQLHLDSKLHSSHNWNEFGYHLLWIILSTNWKSLNISTGYPEVTQACFLEG